MIIHVFQMNQNVNQAWGMYLILSGLHHRLISYPHNVFQDRHFMFLGATSEALFLGFQGFT